MKRVVLTYIQHTDGSKRLGHGRADMRRERERESAQATNSIRARSIIRNYTWKNWTIFRRVTCATLNHDFHSKPVKDVNTFPRFSVTPTENVIRCFPTYTHIHSLTMILSCRRGTSVPAVHSFFATNGSDTDRIKEVETPGRWTALSGSHNNSERISLLFHARSVPWSML